MASSARIEELKKKFDENPRRYFAPLANEFRKTGDYDQAILICQEFLPQQPGHMSGHIVFGQALFEAGRLDEARTVFETALTLDPENLIALKHLGDISRAGGDNDGARSWYRRVLDADPRNEEIASVLASLDEPATVAWTSPTPRSMSAVPGQESRPGAAPERTAENPLETAPPEAPLPDFDAMLSAAAAKGAPSNAPDSTPAAQDASDVIELEDTELNFDASRQPPNDDLGVERSIETPMGFESMTTSAPSREPAFPTLDGLETTSLTPPESAPNADESAGHETPAARDRGHQPTEGSDSSLDSFELASSDEPAASAPAGRQAEAVVRETSAPEQHRDESGQASRTSGSSGFVTETMAELYVQQGHYGEAVAVYQQLVQRYPGDEVLRARLVELETKLAETTVELPIAGDEAASSREEVPEAAAEMYEPELPEEEAFAAPATPVAGSRRLAADTPSIREFLSAIAAMQPAARDAAYASDDAPPEPDESGHDADGATSAAPEDNGVVDDIAFDGTESLGEVATEIHATADDVEPEPVHDEPYEEPVRDESSVRGSIDALFTGAEASNDDEEAASRLADAFSQNVADDEPPMAGQPARRAQDELSLDHVFRERSGAADRGQPAFSFDQFFSQSATERTSNAPADQPGAPTGSPDDDIQQFNAWLEGLKKT